MNLCKTWRLDHACAAQIASLACSHDGITILFLDIVGFTQCSKVRLMATRHDLIKTNA